MSISSCFNNYSIELYN